MNRRKVRSSRWRVKVHSAQCEQARAERPPSVCSAILHLAFTKLVELVNDNGWLL